MIKSPIIFILLFFISCGNDPAISDTKASNDATMSDTMDLYSEKVKEIAVEDSIINSMQHHFKDLIGDLDGDSGNDTVRIVQNKNNKKYGLRILFANGRVDHLGMGKEVINRGFDDFDWVGVFEKVNKGEVYWSNVNEDGEIISDEERIKESNKIKLENDAIFVHQAEACGGGIIYLKNGKYHWIQQE